ncbi:MAG: Sjogren's syndrome/scleroderma autoantigen 1 family protein [Haloferacaceae archaeon]
MSDFDREAERERLREKYERDREKRQSTQRMSELLLKGATMTNQHCGECGDPIFRYEGTEFCPTCEHDGTAAETDEGAGGSDGQAPSDRDAAAADRSAAAAGETTDGTAADRSTPGAVDAASGPGPASESPRSADAGNVADADPQSAGPDEGGSATVDAGDVPRDRGSGAAPTAADVDGAARPDPARVERDAPTGEGGDGAGRATTRASLERTLVRFARAAEGADDPRRARELLAAAREAAEALAALDR